MTNPPPAQPAPVALLTGAGTGIGREAAQELSSRGWRLLLAGRREAPLLETGGMLSGPWHAFPTDVRSAEQCQAAVNAAVERFGRLDALINNAGFAPSQPVPKHTPDLIDEVFAINAQGPAYLMTAAWRLFERQNADDHAKGLEPRGGRIVNISSMASVDPFPGLFAYAGAKAALNLLTRAAHREGADLGIRCFALAPGAVETSMLRAILDTDILPPSRTLPPRAIAVVIADCLEGKHDEHAGEVILLPSP